jgi:hypothetical protein
MNRTGLVVAAALGCVWLSLVRREKYSELQLNDEKDDAVSDYKSCARLAKQRCRDQFPATPPPPPPTAAPGGGGEWQSATMTYYTGKEGASRGAGGKILTPFKSVAVKLADFKRLQNKQLEIQGVGVVAVEDGCAGGACKDFDIYIGADVGNARRLPNWQAGNIPIKYRWL